jgi:TRAP-type C4-dicarboxylate transport system permease small subunit
MKWFIKNFEIVISSIAFTVMLLVIIINVFSRFVFDHSFSFTEEIAFMGFTYTVFFGACMLYKEHSLIAIDILVDKLPIKMRYAARIFNFALLTVANIYFVYLSTILSISAWVRPTAALRIPYTFIDMATTISFFLMTIYSIKFLIVSFKGREEDFIPHDIDKVS